MRLREKGGKRHEVPCHHSLDEYLHAYLDGTGIADDLKGPLFRAVGRGTGRLTRTPLPQANAYAMTTSASTRPSGSGFDRACPRDTRRPAIEEGAVPDDPRTWPGVDGTRCGG